MPAWQPQDKRPLPDAIGTGTQYVKECANSQRDNGYHFPKCGVLMSPDERSDWCASCGLRIFFHPASQNWYSATWHLIIEEP